MADVRFGMQLPSFSFPRSTQPLFEVVKRIARRAEAAEFDSFWVMDHFYQIRGVGPAEEPMLEGWLALAGIASATERIRLGTMVSGNIYRNPALLAKMATTLDVISNGRAFVGVGAGWNREEAEGYGFEFPETPGDRLRRLREALQVLTLMLTQERPSFQGRYYTIDRALNNPRPVQQPHPPILIGGSGERVTLRLVARYGDACNLFGGPERVRHLLGVLREHCRAVGRNYHEILKTSLGTVLIARDEQQLAQKLQAVAPDEASRQALASRAMIGTVAQVAEQLRALLDAGIEYPIVNFLDAWEEETPALFAEAVRLA
ncbi:MAG TPA: LLM class F420-dependent oxidoreductase [Dehalococcoidia bacterium]|nr:LLM class F420-dependent oxidoreductase [Dehalococcoidia bacterium]